MHATWEIWAWLLCWGEEKYVLKWGDSSVEATCMAMHTLLSLQEKAMQTLFKDPSLTDCLDHIHSVHPPALTSEGSSTVGSHCLETFCILGKPRTWAAGATLQTNQTELLFPHVLHWLQTKVGNSLPLCSPACAQRELEPRDKYRHGAC